MVGNEQHMHMDTLLLLPARQLLFFVITSLLDHRSKSMHEFYICEDENERVLVLDIVLGKRESWREGYSKISSESNIIGTFTWRAGKYLGNKGHGVCPAWLSL
jgi:hypothetical protein